MTPDRYQQARTQLLAHLDRLREVRDELAARDPGVLADLPADARQRLPLLDREATRLRNPDLTIAFVGGFSAGKSSLVNAFLGRYLLPESPKVTTAVPTFVRAAGPDEGAELHYLNEAEIETLGQLYRGELAALFRVPELAAAPFSTLVEAVEPLARDGRGRALLDHFKAYQEERRRRPADARGRIVRVGLGDARRVVQDEREAMFLDRVVLRIADSPLPPDVVLVDLPGVSVPNPRHRDITFRFVREEAHAVAFVLNSTQLFNRDEVEILELFRAGETRVADKTFWVLNRWDALSALQQRQTTADFEQRMGEFAIPPGYQAFRTNALHGLLAQLANRGEPPADPALVGHVKDYEDAVPGRYGGSHQTALKESQLPALQAAVLGFLNDRLRETTLRSAADNARANFCGPVGHHLRRVKDAEDAALAGGLRQEEAERSRRSADETFEKRRAGLAAQIAALKNEVAVARSVLLRERMKEIVDTLRAQIEGGPETDAFAMYQQIISEGELRKFPYHFEIEMRVVDHLNTTLKSGFRRLVREQAEEVFAELVERANAGLDPVRADVQYSAAVTAPFDDALRAERDSFASNVDGVVSMLAANLDELLLYRPKSFFGRGGNEILDGLEAAARIGFASLTDTSRTIDPADFVAKTKKIRDTLARHYIDRIGEYQDQIDRDIFPVIIDKMQQIERRLLELLQSKYRPALEAAAARDAEREFAGVRKGAEDRSRRLRETIERVEQAAKDMAGVLAGAG